MKPALLAIDSNQGTVRRYTHNPFIKHVEVKGEAVMPKDEPVNLGNKDGLAVLEHFRKTGGF